MNTGLPRHTTVMLWPSSIGSRLTSVVEAASVSAAGFIWLINGQAAVAAPAAPKAPVAYKRKSRLVSPSPWSLPAVSSAFDIFYPLADFVVVGLIEIMNAQTGNAPQTCFET
jgi:hypothetical protein